MWMDRKGSEGEGRGEGIEKRVYGVDCVWVGKDGVDSLG